ncbi:acyltransferase [Azospirillum sp. TSH64]|uniref:acyltransferase family protein n=1 Tax=Azospirillum sp. TSH64 TaxID=652740 RepID=UPI000D6451D1|nr:acyltransferase [Azospirillum sp. TSH64]
MRFPVLDGWRGLCAVFVALFHFNASGHFYLVPFVRGSYLFVDFFFVLSGFVITHAYIHRLNSTADGRNFLVRRLGRVWPLHAATLIAFIPLEIVKALAVSGETAAFTARFAPSSILSNLFLVHSLGIEDGLTWNIPSWSISAEFLAYVTFAALCLLARRTWLVTMSAVALSAAGAFVVMGWSDQYIDTSFDFGYFRCLYGFFTGHVAYRLFQAARGAGLSRLSLRCPTAGSPIAGLSEGLSLAAVIVFVATARGNALSYASPLLFGLVVWVFAFEGGVISRLLAMRPFQWLGARSYSVYMVHALVIALYEKAAVAMQRLSGQPMFIEQAADGAEDRLIFFGATWMMDLLALAYLGTVVAVASLTHRFVEIPGQSSFNALLLKRRKPAVRPATVEVA